MDEHVMGSADSAIAAEASKRVQAAIEATWECIDGPGTAHVDFRRKQGQDARCIYEAWGFVPKRCGWPLFGSRDLEAMIQWLPDGIQQHAEHHNSIAVAPFGQKFEPILPETHRIVWRARPEVHKVGERWFIYCRFGFMPKDAWLLDTPPQ